MTTPYEKYRPTIEWQEIEKSINDLQDNQDLKLTTSSDHVIGYIAKRIIDSKYEIDFRRKIIVSANRALWGAVTRHLRGVTIDYNPNKIILRAYFDSGATEDDKELIDDALGEILADFPDINDCIYEPIDIPFPEKMTVLKDWIYARHEQYEG